MATVNFALCLQHCGAISDCSIQRRMVLTTCSSLPAIVCSQRLDFGLCTLVTMVLSLLLWWLSGSVVNRAEPTHSWPDLTSDCHILHMAQQPCHRIRDEGGLRFAPGPKIDTGHHEARTTPGLWDLHQAPSDHPGS